MWYLQDMMDACIWKIVFRAIVIFLVGLLSGFIFLCFIIASIIHAHDDPDTRTLVRHYDDYHGDAVPCHFHVYQDGTDRDWDVDDFTRLSENVNPPWLDKHLKEGHPHEISERTHTLEHSHDTYGQHSHEIQVKPPEIEVEKPKTPMRRFQCGVGWTKDAPKVLIYAVELSVERSNHNNPFQVEAIEIRTDGSIKNLDGYRIQLNTIGNTMGRPQRLPDGNLIFQEGILRIKDLDFPVGVQWYVNQRLPSFLYRIVSPIGRTVDVAYSCYIRNLKEILTIEERKFARLERDITVLDWTADFYRSDWRLVEMDAPNAPRLPRKTATTWGALKF